MKKWLKSKICESINNACRALFTKSKKKRKKEANAKCAFGKHKMRFPNAHLMSITHYSIIHGSLFELKLYLKVTT